MAREPQLVNDSEGTSATFETIPDIISISIVVLKPPKCFYKVKQRFYEVCNECVSMNSPSVVVKSSIRIPLHFVKNAYPYWFEAARHFIILVGS